MTATSRTCLKFKTVSTEKRVKGKQTLKY